jgi:hypothetical protein
LDLYPSITTGVLNNFEGHVLLVVLNCGIIVSATNESFGGKDGVL